MDDIVITYHYNNVIARVNNQFFIRELFTGTYRWKKFSIDENPILVFNKWFKPIYAHRLIEQLKQLNLLDE